VSECSVSQQFHYKRLMEPGISRHSRDIYEFLNIPGRNHTVCTLSQAVCFA